MNSFPFSPYPRASRSSEMKTRSISRIGSQLRRSHGVSGFGVSDIVTSPDDHRLNKSLPHEVILREALILADWAGSADEAVGVEVIGERVAALGGGAPRFLRARHGEVFPRDSLRPDGQPHKPVASIHVR